MRPGITLLLLAPVALWALASACVGEADTTGLIPIDSATRTPTATPTATDTPEPTATPTATATPHPTATPTAIPSPPVASAPVTSAGAAVDSSGSGAGAPTGRRLPPPGVAIASLSLPRFGVSAAMESIGLLPDNELDTPHNPYNVGWYFIYDFPGGPGNAVFSGHVDYYPNILGPFYNLADLGVGDAVSLALTDGTVLDYEVLSNTRYSVYTIPMGDIVWPSARPADAEWITLITCGGEFRATTASGAGEYLHRDVVVAQRVN